MIGIFSILIVSSIWSFFLLREIRKRKKVAELINASLKEKETLLQEIHHRVKNRRCSIRELEIGWLQKIDFLLSSNFSQSHLVRKLMAADTDAFVAVVVP